MAKLNSGEAIVDARIVYWGIEGAGKTANLQAVHRGLRPDHRGEIEREATRIDPTVEFEILPIELGEIGGLRTRIQMVAVPGGRDQAPTRKQLIDEVDGIVLVIDSRRDWIDDNAASLQELRDTLADYGRTLEDVPLVLQYNKSDLSDPYALEELHRRLDVRGAAAFEAVATENTGVMQTLSTLSKHVIRSLRDRQFAKDPDAPTAMPAEPVSDRPSADPDPVTELEIPVSQPSPAQRMEDAILSTTEHPDAAAIDDITQQAQSAFDSPWEELDVDDGPPGAQLGPELSIASVGVATRSGERGIRVPIVVSDKDGRTSALVLTVQLDPLLEENRD